MEPLPFTPSYFLNTAFPTATISWTTELDFHLGFSPMISLNKAYAADPIAMIDMGSIKLLS